MARLRHLLIVIIGLTTLFVSTSANALPINSDLGLTPHKEEFIFRIQGRYLSKTDDPSGQNRAVRVYAVPVVGVYGITSKASVLFKVPLLIKEMKTGAGLTRGDEGVGDVAIIGKYRVLTHNFKGGTSRLSALLGLELPTGDDNERDALGILPPALQLGSGSVDAIVGAAHTFQTLDYQVDTDLRYIFNNEANGFEFGDVLRYNLSFQKRILPNPLPEKGIYDQFNLLVELNGLYQDNSDLLGVSQVNSGGHTLFLSPGLQYVKKRAVIEASFQYPVHQDLNGVQLETDYSAVLSFRLQF